MKGSQWHHLMDRLVAAVVWHRAERPNRESARFCDSKVFLSTFDDICAAWDLKRLPASSFRPRRRLQSPTAAAHLSLCRCSAVGDSARRPDPRAVSFISGGIWLTGSVTPGLASRWLRMRRDKLWSKARLRADLPTASCFRATSYAKSRTRSNPPPPSLIAEETDLDLDSKDGKNRSTVYPISRSCCHQHAQPHSHAL